ncbi:MAG: hypothetical protein ACXWPM_09270 [Bdellovibrionota bacterium]
MSKLAWLREKMPEKLDFAPAEVSGQGSESFAGKVAYRKWERTDRIRRGFRQSARILLPIMLGALPLAVLEPFFFMVWGSVFYGAMIAIAGPILFARYWGEEATFYFVEGQCPYCRAAGRLSPFMNTAFGAEIKILCPKCGETSVALIGKAG